MTFLMIHNNNHIVNYYHHYLLLQIYFHLLNHFQNQIFATKHQNHLIYTKKQM